MVLFLDKNRRSYINGDTVYACDCRAYYRYSRKEALSYLELWFELCWFLFCLPQNISVFIQSGKLDARWVRGEQTSVKEGSYVSSVWLPWTTHLPATVHSMGPAGKLCVTMEHMAPALQPLLIHSYTIPPVYHVTWVCDPYLDPASSLDLAFGLKNLIFRPQISASWTPKEPVEGIFSTASVL